MVGELKIAVPKYPLNYSPSGHSPAARRSGTDERTANKARFHE